ncbi:MAG: helix-turn-helix domain-containing protein [Clostridia bacterium]|nr:helix-turn-helix domain-containing protein [Clostridia bacterium]
MDAKKTGGLIAQARKEKGLTQQQLAERLHISHTTVSKWERGLGFPEVSLLEPLAAALGLTLTELFRGEAGKPMPETEVVAEQAIQAAENDLRRSKRQTRIALWTTGIILLSALLWIVGSLFWEKYAAPFDLDLRGAYQSIQIPVDDYGGSWESGHCIQLGVQNWGEEADFWLYIDGSLADFGTWTKRNANLYLLEGAYGAYTVELHRDGSFYLELPGLGRHITMEKVFDVPIVSHETDIGNFAEDLRKNLFGQ